MFDQSDIIISGLNVYTENDCLPNSSVWISQRKIREISPDLSAIPTADLSNVSACRFQFPANYHLIPGRIDMHIHGAGGADFMDASFSAIQQIQTSLAAEGVTAVLATTISETPEKINQALKIIGNYCQTNYSGVEILGVHLEGPFISPKQRGAHGETTLLAPDIALFNEWQNSSSHRIKLVTLAPELPNAIDFIQYLRSQNIIAAIGHTHADFSTTEKAISAGASYATHLFNAMRAFHHRDPGCVGAILLDHRVMAELILDGHHIHPAALNIALQNKGFSNLVLVTDGMRGKCCPEGSFELGGQTVIVEQGAARLKNGVLAGSILTMSQAVKNLLLFTGCRLQDAILMTSVNPARTLNIFDRKGSIACGKDADLVVLNEYYEVVVTIAQGSILFGENAVKL